MKAVTAIAQVRDQLSLYWLARTEQERKFLTIGGATVFGALVYMLAIGPAVDGIRALNVELPKLRLEQSKMQALALEAGELARQPVPQITPMSSASLTASLAARSLATASLSVPGDFAKLQLNGASFANLYTWLDAQRREHRIEVQDLAVTAGTPAGQVDAVLTLRQDTGEASR